MRRRYALPFLAMAIAAWLATSAPADSSMTSVCRAGQLRGKLFDSTGAAGTIVLSVTLTNDGTHCTMKGYAGLRLARGTHLLPTSVAHGYGLPALSQKPRLVQLAHGGAATILIAYSDVVTGTEQSCPKSTAILVRPPGQSGWVRVAAVATACGNGALSESALLAGRRHAP